MCQICGKPVDRRVPHVTIVWSCEFHETISCGGATQVVPLVAEDLILFHNGCAPHRENFAARIAY